MIVSHVCIGSVGCMRRCTDTKCTGRRHMPWRLTYIQTNTQTNTHRYTHRHICSHFWLKFSSSSINPLLRTAGADMAESQRITCQDAVLVHSTLQPFVTTIDWLHDSSALRRGGVDRKAVVKHKKMLQAVVRAVPNMSVSPSTMQDVREADA